MNTDKSACGLSASMVAVTASFQQATTSSDCSDLQPEAAADTSVHGETDKALPMPSKSTRLPAN